jgi:hypothetical protein
VKSIRVGGPPGFAGLVVAPLADGGIKARDMVIALVGPLVDGTRDWPPSWPLRRDEREKLGVLAGSLGLDRESYDQICRIAKRLVADPEFQKLAGLIECVLLHVPVITGGQLQALREAALTRRNQ